MVLKAVPLSTRDAEEDPSANAPADVEEKVAESRHSRGQHSAPRAALADEVDGKCECTKGAEGRVDTHALREHEVDEMEVDVVALEVCTFVS